MGVPVIHALKESTRKYPTILVRTHVGTTYIVFFFHQKHLFSAIDLDKARIFFFKHKVDSGLYFIQDYLTIVLTIVYRLALVNFLFLYGFT